MASAGGRHIPANLLPGNRGEDGGLQTTNTSGFQSQSPIDSPDASRGAPWSDIPPSAPSESTVNPEERSPRQPDSYRSPGRNKSRDRHGNSNGPSTSKSPSGNTRICRVCGEALLGQFVRALGGTFHLECFQCKDCGEIVASKFFPVDSEDGTSQHPLCERDYFRRLNLLCFECGGALRGSYITALDHKYHIEHFTCSVCPTVFGAQDSYYEHEGKVYCHYHYSTQFAQRCNGCQTAILKQFVEIFRNGQNQHWHPECYMIHKFWNVRLSPSGKPFEPPEIDRDVTTEEREQIRDDEEKMEEKVYRIWSVLSAFEESSAACISDMLLHVSNGAYVDGVVVAKKFIFHVEVLFKGTDQLAAQISSLGIKEIAYGREAKLLCKKVVSFFSLLSKTQETGVRKLGVTQELLALVTGLAHYLKLLIRIGLQGSLRLERETKSPEALYNFLDLTADLEEVNNITASDLNADTSQLANSQSDCCAACTEPIDDECIVLGRRLWHKKPPHLVCGACHDDLTHSLERARWSEKNDRPFCQNCAVQRGHDPQAVAGFENVTKLQQYVFLLRVALARLLSVLRSGGTLPHTSDDPNLKQYEANDGHRIPPQADPHLPPQRSNTRSMSYTGEPNSEPAPSSLEQTVGEMRRLRSTRNERAISTTFKKARTSRIISGPESSSVQPGAPGGANSSQNQNFQIVEERDADGEPVADLTFGNQDALTLDDIPRIVAAEQAKEQRPNAYKHAGQNLIGSGGPAAKLVNGHQRGVSVDQRGAMERPRAKKYFSELSALEYFIVRHVAVLSMEPLLEGSFNLEELLGLIEPRKPTIWNIFNRAFKNDPRKVGKKKGVFGVALEVIVERDGTESTHGVGPGTLRIPTFIDDAISAMRQMDMSVEGVFRKNGNIKRLRETAELIDTKYEAAELDKESAVQVAALMKKFLREMPDPLLTFKLHSLFVIAQKIADPVKRKRVLHLTCCLLPKSHRDTMEVLFSFLNWASSFCHVDDETGSKMDIHNLATVMTPNILYSNTKVAGVDDSFLAIEAVTSLIENNDTMCEVPEDLLSILTDSTLFNGSAEITTKEILKRYGALGKLPVPQRAPTVAETIPVRSGSSKGNNSPIAARIDTDPSQATAWQMQSSVRHVHGPQDPSAPFPPQPIRNDSGDNNQIHSQGHSGIPPQQPQHQQHVTQPPLAYRGRPPAI
ncbi:Rho-type GTPase activating protein Rga1 [Microsporum audouinii]